MGKYRKLTHVYYKCDYHVVFGFFVARFTARGFAFFILWMHQHPNAWQYQAMGGRCGLTRAVAGHSRARPWRLDGQGEQPCRDGAWGTVGIVCWVMCENSATCYSPAHLFICFHHSKAKVEWVTSLTRNEEMDY